MLTWRSALTVGKWAIVIPLLVAHEMAWRYRRSWRRRNWN